MSLQQTFILPLLLLAGLGAWCSWPGIGESASLRTELAEEKVAAARSLLQQRDLAGARRVLAEAERILARRGSQALPPVWLLLARTAIAGARFSDAAALVAKAKEAAPTSAEVYTVECELLGNERKTEEAAAACGRALALRPGWAEAQRQLGCVYAATSEPLNVQRAMGLHKAALAGVAALCEACETCCLRGAEDEARQIREVLADDEALSLQLAHADRAAYAPVVQALEASVAELEAEEEVSWARLADARLRLADALRIRGDFAAAQATFEDSVRARDHRPDPEDPTVVTWYEFEGLLAYSRGDLPATRAAYVRTLAGLKRFVGPDNREVHMIEDTLVQLDAELAKGETAE